jgi:hypothetical protein
MSTGSSLRPNRCRCCQPALNEIFTFAGGPIAGKTRAAPTAPQHARAEDGRHFRGQALPGRARHCQRLFRQPNRRDSTSVMAEIAAELAQLLADRPR